MRLRQDRRNYHHVVAWMERINLVHSERARELSRFQIRVSTNLHRRRPEKNDPVINHTIIKADVRGSTRYTRVAGQGHESGVALQHEPARAGEENAGAVRRTATVFIEGDAIILAIEETEASRATKHAVGPRVRARRRSAVTPGLQRAGQDDELAGAGDWSGVAFQDSTPSLWMDGNSKIMISRALNLSDRLSSCLHTKAISSTIRRTQCVLLQPLMEDAAEDESEEPWCAST